MGLIKEKKDIITSKNKIHIIDIIKIYSSQDTLNDFKVLHPYKIDIPKIKNKWKINYSIDSDIKCPFCDESCVISSEKQSRLIDAPMIPKLQLCEYCPGYSKFMSQLDNKQIRLEHDFQYNGSTYHAFYKNKIFLWKKIGYFINENDLVNMIYQSTEFREFILDETELGILTDEFQIEYSFNSNIMEYICFNNVQSTHSSNKPPLYKVNLYRDIDNQITNAKEKAKKESENLKFYFPPKQQVFGATIILDDGMIKGDNDVIPKGRKIHGQLLPSNHCTRIDNFIHLNTNKLEYIRFSVIDTSLALHIMKFCDLYTISQLGKINRWWKRVSYMDYLWKYLLKRDFPDSYKLLKYGGYRIIYKKLYIEEQKKHLSKYEAYDPKDPCYALVK